MLRVCSSVHLYQFCTVPVSSVEGSVKGGHLAALCCSQNSIYPGSVVQKDFARVNVAVEGSYVKGRPTVVSGCV